MCTALASRFEGVGVLVAAGLCGAPYATAPAESTSQRDGLVQPAPVHHMLLRADLSHVDQLRRLGLFARLEPREVDAGRYRLAGLIKAVPHDGLAALRQLALEDGRHQSAGHIVDVGRYLGADGTRQSKLALAARGIHDRERYR